jgi:hypothetical protein
VSEEREHERGRSRLHWLNGPFWDANTHGNAIFAVFSESHIKKSA